ncbi:hypothetical protein ACFVWN_13325 [Nocardiopsis flavescens]|uniref:hypothetical protein n=1 Tax=Nocardiopsis flavescens TaxID=758803 RepID=UPI0036DF7F5E
MNAPDTARRLPAPARLRDLSRRVALLEFLVAPDTRYRKHAFRAEWRPGWDLATMSNGGGDEYAIAFSGTAALIRCFDHESGMSPYANDEEHRPGTVDALPTEFAGLLADPDFEGGDPLAVSALIWWREGSTAWATGVPGDMDDGSGWLLGGLTDEAPQEYYADHFRHYHGRPVDERAAARVLLGEPTAQTAALLDPGAADPADLLRRALSSVDPVRD